MKYDKLRKIYKDVIILEFVKENPGWSHQEYADYFGMSRSNMTRILNKWRWLDKI